MAKNSTEGNKARTARYRAGLAARGIRPVQLYAPEEAHALLRQAAGLMTREQDPLEPHQAMRHASGANDPGHGHDGQGGERQALAAALAEVEAVRAELGEVQDAERQAGQRALVQAEAVQAAERAQVALVGKLQAAEAAVMEARVEAERFQKTPGLRGKVIRWLAQ